MSAPMTRDPAVAAACLVAGGLVALPTETVYGLGGNALDPRAVARIFEAKQRPFFDPLIVHLADRSWLQRVAQNVSPLALRLAEKFWPGPLTLVLPRTSAVPDLVTSGLDTVGVRVPDHPLTREVLRLADCPIAAPSANPFGRLSPTTAQHVAEQLGDRIDLILDGGPCRVGVESTIVRVEGDSLILLRPGGLPIEDLAPFASRIDRPMTVEEQLPTAPGMLPQHYAPRTPVRLWTAGEPWPEGQRVGQLLLSGTADPRAAACEVLSASGDLVEAAAGFFESLHRLDACGLDMILATPFPERGLGVALNDRLTRAAAS